MIIDFQLDNPLWITSQIFAFFALIFLVWSFQIKDKIKMMLLIGLGSLFLAISASFLGNYSLGVLFGLAAIRNFVFSYLDWRVSKGHHVPKMVNYSFAGVFAVLTITATALLWPLGMAFWLELLICLTLLGLIIGNVLKGTNLMRCSFIANRAFNIINHIYFNNAIGVIIAAFAIASNLIYYIRQLIAWMVRRHKARNN